ncbi:hypothetical protein CYLTODRAFT_333372, partial [Cylindrobasidium torrendii FP15055 ss-10]
LLSVGRITESGYSLHFSKSELRIIDSGKRIVGRIEKTNDLYQTRTRRQATAYASDEQRQLLVTPDELHRLMGHIPLDAAKKLAGAVDGLKLDKSAVDPTDECSSCLAGRMTRKQIATPEHPKVAENVGDKVYSDLWGPAPVQTNQHKRYYASFTD